MKRRKFKQPHRDRLYRRKWNKTPKGRYTEQKKRALSRGVPWLFSFESWWQMWQDSGKWEQRGRRYGFYCMARKGDKGPYSPDNCLIVLWEHNCAGAAVASGFCSPDAAPHAPF